MRSCQILCPVPAAKIFGYARRANHFYNLCRPVPKEGRCATSSTREGMRWTRAALETNAPACGRRSRVVLTPRRWRQVGEGNFTGDGGKRARSPGRARRKPLKPLRAGMPGYSGELAVNTRVHLQLPCAHEAAGALGTRHSPRPHFSRGGRFTQTPDATRRGIAKPYHAARVKMAGSGISSLSTRTATAVRPPW